MKILHVTFGLPPYSSGGLPLYVNSLIAKQRTDGDDLFVLEPGSLLGKTKIVKVKASKYKLYRIHGALPVSYNFGVDDPSPYMRKCDKSIYANFLRAIHPDIIHIHSIMGVHKEFFEAASEMKIKMVMTTHDYYGLDLRANFVNNNGETYDDRDPKNTALRNYKKGLSYKRQLIMQSDFYKIIKNCFLLGGVRKGQRRKLEGRNALGVVSGGIITEYGKLLKYYDEIFEQIDYFIFNSSIARDKYKKYLPNVKGEIVFPVLPNMLNDNVDKRFITRDSCLRVVYIGRNEKYKGADILADVVSKNSNVDCKMYGDDFSRYVSANVHSMGMFSRDELRKIMGSSDLLIAPSRYYETFGLTVFEALSAGLPAIVSSHVGARDLLANAPVNVIFEPTSDGLRKCLEDASMPENYEKICRWVAERKFSRDAEKSYRELRSIYEKV